MDGRRVLVTGASSGIGAAAGMLCAHAGARVGWVARRKDRIDRLAAEHGGVAVAADLTDEAQARDAVEQVAKGLGGLDVVVNNAGAMLLGLVADGRPADWRLMYELNVLALLTVTHAAIPHLRSAGNGDVVNIGSIAGKRVAGPTNGVYGGSKAAVHLITEGLRRELHAEGIRVILVSPGIVKTELGRDIADVSTRQRIAGNQERIGLAPEDVARQIVHALGQPRTVLLNEIALLPNEQD